MYFLYGKLAVGQRTQPITKAATIEIIDIFDLGPRHRLRDVGVQGDDRNAQPDGLYGRSTAVRDYTVHIRIILEIVVQARPDLAIVVFESEL